MTGGSKGSHGREGAPQRSILSSLPGNGGSLRSRRTERGTGHPADVAVAVSRSCWPCAVLFPHACLFPCSLSGIIGERLPIRYYLTFGMLASGAFTALFGLGYFYNIHSLGFYVVTQVRACSRFTVRTGMVRVPKQKLVRGRAALPVQGHVSSCWLRNALLPWHLDYYFLFQELSAWQVNEV